MIISEIFSRMCGSLARPFASAMSCAKPTSWSASSTNAESPPSRSQSPSECANTAAWRVSPSRNTRSFGTNTSSKITKPSGMWCRLEIGKRAHVAVARRVGRVHDAHARRRRPAPSPRSRTPPRPPSSPWSGSSSGRARRRRPRCGASRRGSRRRPALRSDDAHVQVRVVLLARAAASGRPSRR